MSRNAVAWILLGVVAFFAGCGSHGSEVMTSRYAPTEKVETVFQKNRIPDSCRVFGQLLVTLPAKYTGNDFTDVLTAEAKAKGADMMSIGQSRQCTTESDLTFTYFDLEREYRVTDWPGWNFGLAEWGEQGEWCGIGYNEWGNSSVRYDYPLILQVALVRCQP